MELARSITALRNGVDLGPHDLSVAPEGFKLTPNVTISEVGGGRRFVSTFSTDVITFKDWVTFNASHSERVIKFGGSGSSEAGQASETLELVVIEKDDLSFLVLFFTLYANREYRPSKKSCNNYEQWLLGARNDDGTDEKGRRMYYWRDEYPGPDLDSNSYVTPQEELTLQNKRSVNVSINDAISQRRNLWFDSQRGLIITAAGDAKHLDVYEYKNLGYRLSIDYATQRIRLFTRDENNWKVLDTIEIQVNKNKKKYFYRISSLIAAYMAKGKRPNETQINLLWEITTSSLILEGKLPVKSESSKKRTSNWNDNVTKMEKKIKLDPTS